MATISDSSHHNHNPSPFPFPSLKPHFDLLAPLRRWLDGLEINNAKVAHLICIIIPCTCPFEREITLFGQKQLRIPPLCKLNPLYNEFVSLRFRSLNYLADTCGEDINKYIC